MGGVIPASLARRVTRCRPCPVASPISVRLRPRRRCSRSKTSWLSVFAAFCRRCQAAGGVDLAHDLGLLVEPLERKPGVLDVDAQGAGGLAQWPVLVVDEPAEGVEVDEVGLDTG